MIIDIIIPTLNEADNLQKLLPYLKSCISNFEAKIIVVDSPDSDDRTATICREEDVVYIQADKSQRAHQMNLGAEQSSADALLFLHADVMPPLSFQQDINKALFKCDCGMFAYRFDKAGSMFRFNAWFTKFDGFFTGGGDQCFFINRSVFNKLGKYNESYQVMEDFEFFGRVKQVGKKYVILPQRAIESARKYEQHSYMKINWVNLKMLISFYLGKNSKALLEQYQSTEL